MCLKDIQQHAWNKLIILGPKINMIGGHLWPLNEHKNLHFDNKVYEFKKLRGKWL